MLNDADALVQEQTPSIPFEDDDPFHQTQFKNSIAAKTAIAEYLGRPLGRLAPVQLDEINRILTETLDKKTVMAEVKAYFTLNLRDRPGDESCTVK